MHKPSVPALLGSVAIMLASTLGAIAQPSTDQRNTLINLDMVQISKDLCGFAMTEAQADAVAARVDQITEQLGMSDDQVQKLYGQLQAQMTRQKASGLCDPKGNWAKLYAKLLAGNGPTQ